MRVASNDHQDKIGLRGYVQLNPARGDAGSMELLAGQGQIAR